MALRIVTLSKVIQPWKDKHHIFFSHLDIHMGVFCLESKLVRDHGGPSSKGEVDRMA